MPEIHYIRGVTIGPVRRRGWVRPGLTVHLAKYDRMAAIGDVGCYHVLCANEHTLCGRNTRRSHWRDAGWGDSEVICCKLCARILWPRWLRDGACDGVDQLAVHTLAEDDNWPAALDETARRAPLAFLSSTSEPLPKGSP
ncbi:MAG: hypothetical protein AB7R89_05560 [Dehalococcoidia bacterium]